MYIFVPQPNAASSHGRATLCDQEARTGNTGITTTITENGEKTAQVYSNTSLIACKNVIKKCHSKFMYGGTYFFRNRRYIKSYAQVFHVKTKLYLFENDAKLDFSSTKTYCAVSPNVI